VTTWLIDKSALVRLADSPDAAEWAARIERGLVRITTVTRLETGYSARSGSQMRAGFLRPPLSSMPVEYLTPAIEDRAVELLTLLADRGQHRAPSIPDLIIAATAELAGLTVLHLDKDFDLIAEITGQSTERLNMDSAAEIGDDAEQTEALSFPDSGGYGRRATRKERTPAAAAHRRAGRQHPRAQRHRWDHHGRSPDGACRSAGMPGAGPMIPMCDDQEDGARACPGYAPGGAAGQRLSQ
jgi:predicted nucleic acid-binding protein